MAPYTCLSTRARIIAYKELGLPNHAVAEKLGGTIHFTTVGNIYRNHRKGLDIFKNWQKPGRPRIFSSKDAHFAALCLARNTARSAADIHHCYYPRVSTSTIRQCLHELDLSPYKCRQKPYLSCKHKWRRWDWARQHRSWSLTQWHWVAFADEKKFDAYAAYTVHPILIIIAGGSRVRLL
jgi:transposase